MGALSDLRAALEAAWRNWQALRVDDLQFAREDAALLAIAALAGAAAVLLLARLLAGRAAGRGRVALPAIPAWMPRARVAAVRHGALLLFLAGVPCFVVALAGPEDALTRQEAAYPGRRISLMIDASSSMLTSFGRGELTARAPNDATFFTTVGAAEYFVELRRQGRYRDLLALVEFGDEAYVITPFTTDYDNILLSISLIGDWNEFMLFPDQGTVIAKAIEQSVGLFEAFDFLDASGNLMVIFTDGIDAEVTEEGRSVFDVLRDAERAQIPVYFIRTARATGRGPDVSDAAWRAAVARTGGRFYSAADEATLVRAMHEIDEASAGRIELREYATREPRFEPFALAAVALWACAIALQLSIPVFRTFP